jgi:hypothetical protein
MGEKPKTLYCKRTALMRWTGWSEKYIHYLVTEGLLKIAPRKRNGRLQYSVYSAQEIHDATK